MSGIVVTECARCASGSQRAQNRPAGHSLMMGRGTPVTYLSLILSRAFFAWPYRKTVGGYAKNARLSGGGRSRRQPRVRASAWRARSATFCPVKPYSSNSAEPAAEAP